MTIAQKIALWSDMLRDISATGLTYAENVYDQDRYQSIQNLAIEMLSDATGIDADEIEKLRTPVLSRPTPMTVADAAVFDDEERILLIQRADNHKWAMPGGFLEVGETVAEGAAREAHEESGIACKPVQLVGLYDSRICGSITSHHMYMVTVLCKPVGEIYEGAHREASHAHEVLDSGWFPEADLPEQLSPGHDVRIKDAFGVLRGDSRAYLDA